MELRPLGLVTCSSFPDLAKDDDILRQQLQSQGLKTRVVVWDDPAVDWNDLSALLIRSTWDYHLKLPDFLIWLESVERRCVPVWNPLDTLRANVAKTYLKSCPGAVPTVWLEAGQDADVDAILLSQGWDEAVVKPVVSASAHGTKRLRRGDPGAKEVVAAAVSPHGAMLQPFFGDVLTEGEWSFIFVDGLYTHAVLKTPKAGDFRVQEEHGGRTAPAQPSDKLIDEARRALSCIATPWLYARVDALRNGDTLLISEIELVEPSLYFTHEPKAAQRLAESIKKRL